MKPSIMKPWLMAAVLSLATPLYAVQPDEVLDDPVLENRARVLSKDLRCLVCRNENIDESDAALAKDLRILVRERLVAGDSDAEAMAFIVARYGEYVLLNPTLSGANKLLWYAGPAMLLMGLGIGYGFLRRRTNEPEMAALDDDEKAQLQKLLGDDPSA